MSGIVGDVGVDTRQVEQVSDGGGGVDVRGSSKRRIYDENLGEVSEQRPAKEMAQGAIW